MIASVIIQEDISREIGIVNFSLPAVALFGMVFLQIKFSGVPARSQMWKSQLKKINVVTVFWSIARLASGIDNILAEYSDSSISNNITNKTDHAIDTVAAAFMILSLIISEVVCMVLVLDYGFMGIFLFSEDDEGSAVSKTQASFVSTDKDNITNFSMVITDLMMTVDDIVIEDELQVRKNGLGKLYKATYNGAPVIFRKILFKRLSGYVLEEFTAEIDRYQNLVSNKIIPIIGVILDLPTVGIVSPYMARGSLYKALHVDHINFTRKDKFKLALEMSSVLETIHSQNKAHGHLTSENILLNDDGVAVIADLGFQKMKKYAGVIFGYTNKSG